MSLSPSATTSSTFINDFLCSSFFTLSPNLVCFFLHHQSPRNLQFNIYLNNMARSILMATRADAAGVIEHNKGVRSKINNNNNGNNLSLIPLLAFLALFVCFVSSVQSASLAAAGTDVIVEHGKHIRVDYFSNWKMIIFCIIFNSRHFYFVYLFHFEFSFCYIPQKT